MHTLLLPLLALLPPPLPTLPLTTTILLPLLHWRSLPTTLSPLTLELVLTLLTRTTFYLVPALLLTATDSHGRRPRGRPRRDPRALSVAGVVVANLALGALAQVALEWTATEALRLRSSVRVCGGLPRAGEVARGVLAALAARELLQYVFHARLLHPPHARTFLSELHARAGHALPPGPLAPHYDHPVPYLLGRFLPAYVPALVLRPHLLTHLVFLALVSLQEALALSGVRGLGPAWDGLADAMEEHWLGGGKRAFADLGVVDRVVGTASEGRRKRADRRSSAAGRQSPGGKSAILG